MIPDTLAVSSASAYVVAATTILFSEEKTVEWISAVAMSLLWRNFVIDPLKAVAFGRSFELMFGLLLGGSCAFDEAALGVLQDEMEGQGEALGEVAEDAATGALAENVKNIDIDGAQMDGVMTGARVAQIDLELTLIDFRAGLMT